MGTIILVLKLKVAILASHCRKEPKNFTDNTASSLYSRNKEEREEHDI